MTRPLQHQPYPAVERWFRNTAEPSGELSVGDIVAAACAAAGLAAPGEERRYSGHSLRRGGATSMLTGGGPAAQRQPPRPLGRQFPLVRRLRRGSRRLRRRQPDQGPAVNRRPPAAGVRLTVRHLHILCEGQTEEIIARDVIEPHFVRGEIWVTRSIFTTRRPAGGCLVINLTLINLVRTRSCPSPTGPRFST